MSVSNGLLAMVVVLVIAPSAAFAKSAYSHGTLREQAEQACYTDATTLCSDAVPDEAKVTACMKVKRSQLSPKCRAIFDKGIKG